MAKTPLKIADEPDIIQINSIVEPHVKMTSIMNEINCNNIYKRDGVAPGGLALLLVVMSFCGHFGQPVPIAVHWLIGQFLPYWRMRGNWHGLAKKAAKTDLSW